jgi:hypothetical protein
MTEQFGVLALPDWSDAQSRLAGNCTGTVERDASTFFFQWF